MGIRHLYTSIAQHIIYVIVFVYCSALTLSTASAKEPEYDMQEYQKAYDHFQKVIASGDIDQYKSLAEEMRKWGKKSHNYRISFLYYEAMRYYNYYSGVPDSLSILLYDEGIDEARSVGSEMYLWAYMDARAQNVIYIDVAKAMDYADEMMQEAIEKSSVYGQLNAYNTLAFIYAFRDEYMMAVDMAEKGVQLGEEHKHEDENIEKFLVQSLYYRLAECYDGLYNMQDKALETYNRLEYAIRNSSYKSSISLEQRLLDIDMQRAYVLFEAERYEEFRALITKLQRLDAYETSINNGRNTRLQVCISLAEGDTEGAMQIIDDFPDEESKHELLYLFYKYLGDYKTAIGQRELSQIIRDSSTYQLRLQDMAAVDAKLGNAKLREENALKEKQKQRILFGSFVGVLLLVVGFLTLLYIRNRKHTRILSEKNVQLKEARDEAEAQRDEAQAQRLVAEEQRSIAEEKRQEADEQRAEAEKQRSVAEEQRAEAEKQRNVAEEQRAIADEKRLEADEQRAIAEEKRQEAEEHRAEAETQRAAAEVARHQAEQANEMKGHFIENMMHEIRTPLNAISGFSALLTDPRAAEDPESMVEASDMISKNTQHLVHLLDDIIQISNYESLSVDIDMQDASICEILLTSVMNAPQSAVGIQIQPVVENLADDPQMFSCQDMLQRAFGCLLNNSIKFTKEGSIRVGAEFDDENVTFWVEDSGPGIPDGEEEHIFERFVKLDNFVPGTGLGLSLARAIINAIQGEVKVDRSFTGQGSRFVIIVPRNLALLGTGRPKQPFVMEAMPDPGQPAAPTIPEEDILAVLEEMQKEDPNITRDDVIAMLSAGGMM